MFLDCGMELSRAVLYFLIHKYLKWISTQWDAVQVVLIQKSNL